MVTPIMTGASAGNGSRRSLNQSGREMKFCAQLFFASGHLSSVALVIEARRCRMPCNTRILTFPPESVREPGHFALRFPMKWQFHRRIACSRRVRGKREHVGRFVFSRKRRFRALMSALEVKSTLIAPCNPRRGGTRDKAAQSNSVRSATGF